MKKRILATALFVCTTISLIGCTGKKEEVVEQSEKSYKLADYVTLGDYKGIEAQKLESTEVTDEEVEYEIEYELDQMAKTEEITDRGVQDGDTVDINCDATMDGETYEMGSFENYPLKMGSGEFIDGFESGLVGKNIGEEVELNLTFPDDYEMDYEEDKVAGKDVQFIVKINSISVVTVPELSEEYVKENTDYQTVEEYKEGLRQSLKETNDENNQEELVNVIFEQVAANATVEGYPEELYDEFYGMIKSNYESMAELYGLEAEEFYSTFGMTEDILKDEAISEIQNYLIWQMIAQVEKLELTELEYKEGIEGLITYYSEQDTDEYSVEEFEELYGKEEIAEELLRKKVMEFLVSEAKVTEVSDEEYNLDEDFDMDDLEEEEDGSLDDEAEAEMLQDEADGAQEIDENDIQEVE